MHYIACVLYTRKCVNLQDFLFLSIAKKICFEPYQCTIFLHCIALTRQCIVYRIFTSVYIIWNSLHLEVFNHRDWLQNFYFQIPRFSAIKLVYYVLYTRCNIFRFFLWKNIMFIIHACAIYTSKYGNLHNLRFSSFTKKKLLWNILRPLVLKIFLHYIALIC